ncbi:glycosyltransferase [Parabacteroides distasonis]|nr:glycosyltransferase [Parabacteroides distasonis]
MKTKKLKKENAFVVHWGGDLAFYDRLIAKRQTSSHFISTGRENRDFITLIRAFSQLTESCDIYTTRFGGRVSDYELLVQKEIGVLKENIHFHIVDSTHLEMAEKTNNAFAILICCLDFPYTVGLTSLVEALALGLPILSTDNPTFPFDVEKEQVGIKIAYGDVNGWVEAIQYLSSHPEKAKRLGENARRLAERTYNLERCTKEIALALLTV